MSGNRPDDWNAYWRRCSRCGARYHASDGGCEECVDVTDEEIEDAQSEREYLLEKKWDEERDERHG